MRSLQLGRELHGIRSNKVLVQLPTTQVQLMKPNIMVPCSCNRANHSFSRGLDKVSLRKLMVQDTCHQLWNSLNVLMQATRTEALLTPWENPLSLKNQKHGCPIHKVLCWTQWRKLKRHQVQLEMIRRPRRTCTTDSTKRLSWKRNSWKRRNKSTREWTPHVRSSQTSTNTKISSNQESRSLKLKMMMKQLRKSRLRRDRFKEAHVVRKSVRQRSKIPGNFRDRNSHRNLQITWNALSVVKIYQWQ